MCCCLQKIDIFSTIFIPPCPFVQEKPDNFRMFAFWCCIFSTLCMASAPFSKKSLVISVWPTGCNLKCITIFSTLCVHICPLFQEKFGNFHMTLIWTSKLDKSGSSGWNHGRMASVPAWAPLFLGSELQADHPDYSPVTSLYRLNGLPRSKIHDRNTKSLQVVFVNIHGHMLSIPWVPPEYSVDTCWTFHGLQFHSMPSTL